MPQRAGEQAHGVHGLTQIVAGGGQEAALGPIGRLGRQPRRLGRGLLDAQLLEQSIGAPLELEGAQQGVPEFTHQHKGQRNHEKQDASLSVTVVASTVGDAHDDRPEVENVKQQEGARVIEQHGNRCDAQGVADDEQHIVIGAVEMGVEQPRASTPQRGRGQHRADPPRQPAS